MNSVQKQFALKIPCSNCPFRNDADSIVLRPGRREEIIEGLLSGEDSTFHCHKTVYRVDGRNFDEDDNYKPVDVCHCPGAAMAARKHGRDTTAVQVATLLGLIPSDHFDEALTLTLETDCLEIDRDRARI